MKCSLKVCSKSLVHILAWEELTATPAAPHAQNQQHGHLITTVPCAPEAQTREAGGQSSLSLGPSGSSFGAKWKAAESGAIDKSELMSCCRLFYFPLQTHQQKPILCPDIAKSTTIYTPQQISQPSFEPQCAAVPHPVFSLNSHL